MFKNEGTPKEDMMNLPIFLGIGMIFATYLYEKAKKELSGGEMIALGVLKIIGVC